MPPLLPPIVFFGPPGLEAQIFHSYLTHSGYWVQVVHTRERALNALDAEPGALAVIALKETPDQFIELIHTIRAHTGQPERPIFALVEEEDLELNLYDVQVFPRPFRLSDVIKHIVALTLTKT